MREATAGAAAICSTSDQASSTHIKINVFLMYDVGTGVLLSAMNKCTQFAMTFKCTERHNILFYEMKCTAGGLSFVCSKKFNSYASSVLH